MIQISKISIIIASILDRFLNIKSTSSILFLLCFMVWNTAMSQTSGLFDSDEILELNLRVDLKKVLRDRGNDSKYHATTLRYKADRTTMDIPIKIKTRGHFRKKASNCKYPPILLNFKKSTIQLKIVFDAVNVNPSA